MSGRTFQYSITAAHACVGRSRTVTVNVPYGPNGETLVTFYNRITLGQTKICKAITPGSVDSLGNKTFTYHVYVNGRTFTVGPIAPGECQFILDSFGNPRGFLILDSSGNPVIVGAIEDNATDTTPTLGTFNFSKLALTGGSNPQTLCQPASYSPTGHHCHVFVPMVLTGFTPLNVHIAWQLGASVNAVTFTNSAGDP